MVGMKIRGFFLAVALWCSAVQAQTNQGPVSLANGGAGRAAIIPSEAGALNPAMLPHLRGYYVFGRYDSFQRNNSAQMGWGASITDAGEDVFVPATVSYYRWTERLAGSESTLQDIQLGLGARLFSNFSFGMVGRRLSTSGGGRSDKAQYNAGLGILYLPLPQLGLAITGNDILETPEIPMNPLWSFGMNLILEKLARFSCDLTAPQKDNPHKRYQYAMGVESLFAHGFKMRLGHNWDNYNSRVWAAAGLGWDAPKFSLDYAYQKMLEVDEYRHVVDLGIQF